VPHSDHGQSINYAHTECEEVRVLVDKNTGEFSSDDIIFEGDYKQVVIPGIHVISDSESDNGSGEQEEENKHWIGRIAKHIFLAKYRFISHFGRKCYGVYGPPFNIAELDVVRVFEITFGIRRLYRKS
jgi:hypothetical protein